MEPIVEPYNMFAQQKSAGYPNAAQIQQEQQKRVPGQVQGATVQDFVQGKQGANSQAVGANPVVQAQPSVQTQQTVTPSAPVKTTPANTTAAGQSTQPQYGQITSMDDLARAMNYTTPEEEDRLRKASVANQRIMAIGDALRHIGNIAHTVKYAPSQQFNSPVAEEQARYEKGKAIRDAANRQYLAYQQAKAAQDAKQRQWEAEFGIKAANAADLAAYRKRQGDIAAGNAASQAAYREGNLARQKQRDADQKAHNEASLKQRTAYQNRMAGIAGMNAQNNKRRTDAYVERMKNGGGQGSSGIAALDTPKGLITPSGRSYNNQIQQMWDYAESQGLVKKSDVQKALAEAGNFGKETPENIKRQQVMSLLRNNQSMADYAVNRLGWSYSGENNGPSIGWDDDEENDDLEIGW